MKTRVIAIPWGFATLLLVGCMVGPKYVKPTAPTAPEFKEAPPESFKESDGWKPAQPSDQTIRGKWWELFGDPQLNAFEDQLTVSNQNLKVAEDRLRQARAQIRFTRASLAPTLSTAPSISSLRDSANQPYFPPTVAANSTGNFILPFDLSYEVDLWGRVRRTISAAREEAQATAADLQTADLSLHAELAMDYFELRSADSQKQLLDDTVNAYTDALNLTQSRYDGGASPKSDVAQAKTQLDAARVQDTDITITRAQFEHAIATLIGVPPAQFMSAYPQVCSSVALISPPANAVSRRPITRSASRVPPFTPR